MLLVLLANFAAGFMKPAAGLIVKRTYRNPSETVRAGVVTPNTQKPRELVQLEPGTRL